MRTANRQHVEPAELLARRAGAPLPLPARLHLERCAPCHDGLEEAEAVVLDARTDRLAGPPAALRTSALALLSGRPSLPAPAPEVLVGTRERPSDGAPPPEGGIRGETEARRVVYRFPEADVAVEASEGRRGRRLIGQVRSRKGSRLPLLAWAETGGREVAESPVSRYGVFVLDALPDAPIDVLLDDGDARLRLVVEREAHP